MPAEAKAKFGLPHEYARIRDGMSLFCAPFDICLTHIRHVTARAGTRSCPCAPRGAMIPPRYGASLGCSERALAGWGCGCGCGCVVCVRVCVCVWVGGVTPSCPQCVVGRGLGDDEGVLQRRAAPHGGPAGSAQRRGVWGGWGVCVWGGVSSSLQPRAARGGDHHAAPQVRLRVGRFPHSGARRAPAGDD